MEKCDEKSVRNQYREITKKLIEKGKTITTMESCTSGQIASLITDTEGASAVIKGAFVTYSNEGKIMQGVPAETIDKFGVYSKETAAEMAKACRKAYKADIGIGITGTFGNADPDNADSVPGRVFFAFDFFEGTKTFEKNLLHQKNRLDYKMAIAKEIADELEKII
ncbi:MAG: CinA family protein [Oscillospiraceae bacterium]|nr:CinA family protein [Oscillospiraceae bacterium]MBQ3530370.1 CinA family protein [Oscillospiraceae bacterium]